MQLFNTTQNCKEKVSRLIHMYADQQEEIPVITAGNIGVIVGLKNTRTGDTLVHLQSSQMRSLQLERMLLPPPVFYCAIEPATRNDEEAVQHALNMLLLEDPSLHLTYASESGQTLLSGMGELHLDIVRDRLHTDFKVNAEMSRPHITYRETVGQSVSHEYVYDKVVLDKPLLAGLTVTVERFDDEEECSDSVQEPIEVAWKSEYGLKDNERKELEDAICRGITFSLLRGPILGFPVIRVRVRVSEATFHSAQESTPAAYQACAAHALQEALRLSCPSLLEPLMQVSISTHSPDLGSILSDLTSQRRATIESMQGSDVDDAFEVKAKVPLQVMRDYANGKSVTCMCAMFILTLLFETSSEVAYSRQGQL
jgi:elongation factor G